MTLRVVRSGYVVVFPLSRKEPFFKPFIPVQCSMEAVTQKYAKPSDAHANTYRVARDI
jgi:hypothetical protein